MIGSKVPSISFLGCVTGSITSSILLLDLLREGIYVWYDFSQNFPTSPWRHQVSNKMESATTKLIISDFCT